MNHQQLNSEDWNKVEKKRGFFRSYARDFGKVSAGNFVLLVGNMIVFVLQNKSVDDSLQVSQFLRIFDKRHFKLAVIKQNLPADDSSESAD